VYLFVILPTILIALACSSLTAFPTPAAEPARTTYRYDNLPDAEHPDASLSEYRAISQWGKFDLTFYFTNGTDRLSGDRERELVHEAFALWAAQTPLTFTEVDDPSQADILVSWARGDHGDGDPFDGPGDVLAHASYPNPYRERQVILHFDDDERWVDSATQDVDLLTVAAHEIGHTLGLDHSSDPNSLMFPAYVGPHRFLSQDDVAGIQSLYGIDAEPPGKPEVPPTDATPPPSQNEDRDNDAISDEDEIFRTGTDPANPDTDGDGLGDGLEVYYGMNPLDADMDRDGVSDGQEVASGTDPFFPDQSNEIPPELEKEISNFLTEAIELQIEAYARGDASLAASIMAGNVLDQLETDIASLNQRALVSLSEIDYYDSYIHDIRIISQTHLEVDTCEVWSTATYRLSDGGLVDSTGPDLLPQTITIQNLGSGWFITEVEFYDPPAFCR
jgi:hypothetical protein